MRIRISVRFCSLGLRSAIAALAVAALGACAPKEAARPTEPTAKPIASYCTSVSTPSNPVTVSGKALYQYRIDGNGVVADGARVLSPLARVSGQSYSGTINGTNFSWTCDTASCTASIAATRLATAINVQVASVSATAAGTKVNLLAKTEGGDTPTVASLVSFGTTTTNEAPRPIRFAEIRVTDGGGTVIQCGETDANGDFSLSLPGDGATYSVSVTSRANNTKNTAYVLSTPTENDFYKISTSVSTSAAVSGLRLLAKATDTLEGGAFNILDQILNSQDYLRAQTANCATSGNASFFPDCAPFSVAPLVLVYWKPGVSPGVYAGISGGISYYLNGQRELYILGGVNGDTSTTDMDHFDDSVIIHEYAHFLEDQYGSPNSPGGAHNGNSIIDPRLAWGEGWSNFFQAAVTGNPVYRDTYGVVGCVPTGSRPCFGANFSEPLDPTDNNYFDKPTVLGEGNFREFSISRALYDMVKTTNGFTQIWTAIAGTSSGMKAVDDPFKTISRFHTIQDAMGGRTDFESIRTSELQRATRNDYATPFSTATSCSTSPVTMNIVKAASDDGSFAMSDQFRNNDFYVYTHTSGAASFTLSWTAGGPVDLDLYMYRPGYVFGNSSALVAVDQNESSGTSGTATIVAPNLAPGKYLINVMAFTGLYSGTASQTAVYTLRYNGSNICPTP